ncbi:YceI family protein [Poritiphilus flavus]|uniref:YceI family protein n=1 Tax=Poritiphilus flavus TaxID=2697053 RepID=A0A6L9E7K2_9FLAO|nr:YceI family protein [Poritiphilus flavus]NAS10707.1 YceI family protein [Poritiphilus flavus]
MNKLIPIFFLFLLSGQQQQEKIIARQGRVAFFSYTSVENIKAENNQVLSIIDLSNDEIAVSMLMNAFVFEKALMREHFNESYVESDIYPKATFEGKIIDFDPAQDGEQTRMVKGTFSMHGVSKELEIKTKIEKVQGKYILSGTFEAFVKDYDIKVPPLLAGNIAKTISVDFRFEYQPYES